VILASSHRLPAAKSAVRLAETARGQAEIGCFQNGDLDRHQPPVGAKRMTVHVGRFIRAEPDDHFGHHRWLSHPGHRRIADDSVDELGILLQETCNHRGVDHPDGTAH